MPALIGVSMKLAIDAKRKGFNWFRAISSFITGLGCAYLSSSLVLDHLSSELSPIVIAAIAMSGEHIGDWLIYKFKIDSIAVSLLNWMIDRIKQ